MYYLRLDEMEYQLGRRTHDKELRSMIQRISGRNTFRNLDTETRDCYKLGAIKRVIEDDWFGKYGNYENDLTGQELVRLFPDRVHKLPDWNEGHNTWTKNVELINSRFSLNVTQDKPSSTVLSQGRFYAFASHCLKSNPSRRHSVKRAFNSANEAMEWANGDGAATAYILSMEEAHGRVLGQHYPPGNQTRTIIQDGVISGITIVN